MALGVLSLICLFSLAFANRASAEPVDLDFTLHNATGYTLYSVFVAKPGATDWGQDVLGESTLEDKKEKRLPFRPKNSPRCGISRSIIQINPVMNG